MAAEILTQFKQKIAEFTLQPSSGGCFELTVNDQLVYSKLATGSFPDEADIARQVQRLMAV